MSLPTSRKEIMPSIRRAISGMAIPFDLLNPLMRQVSVAYSVLLLFITYLAWDDNLRSFDTFGYWTILADLLT
jgi:hypothetical protein